MFFLKKPPGALDGMPPEVLAMIVKAPENNGKPVLSLEDISDLRLVSRRIVDTSLGPCGDRLFAERKFMLSRSSLAALEVLVEDPNLDNLVRGIAIGPERINPGLKSFLGYPFTLRMAKINAAEWTRKYEPIWRASLTNRLHSRPAVEILLHLESPYEHSPTCDMYTLTAFRTVRAMTPGLPLGEPSR